MIWYGEGVSFNGNHFPIYKYIKLTYILKLYNGICQLYHNNLKKESIRFYMREKYVLFVKGH